MPLFWQPPDLTGWARPQLIKQVLPAELMCPAAGQGALAIEIRRSDSSSREHLRFLDDQAARMATTCERALLNKLGGGCQVPIGAFAEMAGGKLTLTAICARPDGGKLVREVQTGSDSVELGERTGALILQRGGEEILREVYGSAAIAPQQP